MTVTSFGHSPVEIALDAGTYLLVDPFISGDPHAEGVATAAPQSPGASVLAHAHGDPYGDTEGRVNRAAPLVVGPYEVATCVTAQTGREHVHPMSMGGGWDFGGGRLMNTREARLLAPGESLAV